ncbi:hypothetical protein COT72_01300 [archaeon CG10_big_fil_rev_8_21_14_0_10_43_11]|nr:MAG: hypothetical protein COT72_01300 [archaeon CG10_big_fil_rev_8_21_14_0_10_43_11]
MIALAHALFGAVFALLFRLNPFIVILFSLVPDAEFILPTFHRGPLHTLLFLVVASLGAYAYDKDAGKAVFAGIASHFMLDSLTVMGVPLLYPFVNSYFSLHFFNTNQLSMLTIIVCVVVLFHNKKVSHAKAPKLFFVLPLLVLVPLLGSTQPIFEQSCPAELTPISEVTLYAGEPVLVEGVICSEIKDYTSNSGNAYQDFQLCNQSEVRVFKQKNVHQNVLARGDAVRVCGYYTTDYGGELYHIKFVKKN